MGTKNRSDGKRVLKFLKLLVQNPPKKVYTKEQMYSLIWNDAYLGDEKCGQCSYQQAAEQNRRASEISEIYHYGMGNRI